MVTREQILVTIDKTEEPNETKMTVIKIDGCQMEFRSFSGFTALDIYNLLLERSNNNEH